MELKPFQKEHVNSLVFKVKKLLRNEQKGQICVFQSPTGSGKTIMSSDFIKKIVHDCSDTPITFLWVSIGKGNLHEQSMGKLQHYFGGFPRVSLLEEEMVGTLNELARNEVYVLNWEKISNKKNGEWVNVLMREGERANFFDVLEQTHLSQTKIILMIDESHERTNTERTQELFNVIKADVIMYISATPLKTSLDEIEKISMSEPIREELIKKHVLINHELGKQVEENKNADSLLLEKAYRLRLTLKGLLEQEGSNVNPLVLIQIPDKKNGETYSAFTREWLAEKGILTTNGKLGIWLDKEHENLKTISNPNDSVEFLIFKKAIATGWDCPRATILVKYRDSASEIFEIQTVGRILRMPEQKHYSQDRLNVGYVFSNAQSVTLIPNEGAKPNFLRDTLVNLKESLREPIDAFSLPMEKVKKEKVSLFQQPIALWDALKTQSQLLWGISENQLESTKRYQLITIHGFIAPEVSNTTNIMADVELDVHKLEGEGYELEGKEWIRARKSEAVVEKEYRKVIGELVHASQQWIDRQQMYKELMNLVEYHLLGNELNEAQISSEMIQNFIIANKDKFLKLIVDIVGGREKPSNNIIQIVGDFRLAPTVSFNQDVAKDIRKEIPSLTHLLDTYAYETPWLTNKLWQPEKDFLIFMDKKFAHRIKWWVKNGECGAKPMTIPYQHESESFNHEPDFIIEFTDGTIGIFETKDKQEFEHERVKIDGSTAHKIPAIQKYVIETSLKQGRRLIGGVVSNLNGMTVHLENNEDVPLETYLRRMLG